MTEVEQEQGKAMLFKDEIQMLKRVPFFSEMEPVLARFAWMSRFVSNKLSLKWFILREAGAGSHPLPLYDGWNS